MIEKTGCDKPVFLMFILFLNLFQKLLNLSGWADNRFNRDIVIQTIHDTCCEFCHISFYIIWLCEKLWITIIQIRGNYLIDVFFLIEFIEFLKSIGEETECSAVWQHPAYSLRKKSYRQQLLRLCLLQRSQGIHELQSDSFH